MQDLCEGKLEKAKGYYLDVRRKFKGCVLIPNIGDRSDKKILHYLPNQFKKRKENVETAAQLDVVMTNKLATLSSHLDE